MKKTYILVIFTLLLTPSIAQFNLTFRKYYNKAEEFIVVDNYKDALPFLLKLDSMVPNNPNVSFLLGLSYFMLGKDIDLSKQYLEKALPHISADYYGKFNETSAPVFTFYYLGRIHQMLNEFDQALDYYQRFQYYLTSEDKEWQQDVLQRINQLHNAKLYYENPLRMRIQNLGPVINTSYPEYAPVFAPDLSYIIFTSRRPGSTGGKRDLTGQYFEDIYIADFDPQTLRVSNVRPLPGNVNSDGHEASISISWDGQYLFIYKDDRGDGNIYMSKKENNEWKPPVKLAAPVNTKYYENHAFLAPDNETLYFVSNRPGGYGGKDIWMCKRLGENKWSEPVNLGPTINTPYDEDSPIILFDGKTLYFSSKGHENMGGYDIFVSTLDNNNQWTKPINVGYPINTTGDDIFFYPALDGSKAIIAQNKPDGMGSYDLYFIEILEPMDMLATIRGFIRDTINNRIVRANIDVYDLTYNQLIVQTMNDPHTGEYSFSVPTGREYETQFHTELGFTFTDKFSIPLVMGQRQSFFQPYYLVTPPEPASVEPIVKNIEIGQRMGDRFVLRNVHFDYDKATLRPESYEELDRLIALMNDFPDIKIEVYGHTDNIGSPSYNQKLSEERAKAVVDYVVSKGIARNRLSYKGFGASQPIASNETEIGRQLNRRVEFKISGLGTFEQYQYTDFKYDPALRQQFVHRYDQPQQQKKYHIIAGSFSFLKNAEAAREQYLKLGYSDAQILGLSSVGTFRLSIKSFDTKEQALKELSRIRRELQNEQLWIFEY